MPCKVLQPWARRSLWRKQTQHIAYPEMYASSNLSNLREKRLERTLPKDHEHRIAGKGFNWLGHHNLVQKFISMGRATKIPDAQAAVDQEWGKARKIASMASDVSQEQKKRSLKRHRKKDSSVFHTKRCAISKTRSWNPSSKSTNDVVVLRGGIVKEAHTLHSPSRVRQHHK